MRPWPGGKKTRGGRASHPMELSGDWVVSPPVCVTGVSLLAVWYLIGAPPRSHPWASAVTLPHRRNRLSARRMAAWETFCKPVLRRHVHRELLRSAWLAVTPIISATACLQRNYVERYSRSNKTKCQPALTFVSWPRAETPYCGSPVFGQSLPSWSSL
jgi:hypothetical protein